MIEVRHLTKSFAQRRGPDFEAVRGISFTCRPGEITGLLGRNGAGKTTTLRILSTILRPTAGEARVAGHDVVSNPQTVRGQLGFLTGDTRLYDRLTGREALTYFGRLHGLADDHIARRVDEVSSRFELESTLDRRTGPLSTGQKQRLSLARAILHDPPVVILDEPTAGLDILAARQTLDLIVRLREDGRTVLFSSHHLHEVERVCDRVGILDRGCLLADAPPGEIAAAGTGTLEDTFVHLVTGRLAPLIDPVPT